MLGDGPEAERQLRDHGERSLGADEDAREVVTRPRSCGAREPVADHRAVREHGLEREQVGAHLPVAHRRRSRRVRRRHAAERGVGAGVDREEEAVLARGSLEREPRDAGRDRRRQIARRDLERAGQPREVEADSAGTGITWPSRLVPAPNGGHRHPVRARERENPRNVLGRRGRRRGRAGGLRGT